MIVSVSIMASDIKVEFVTLNKGQGEVRFLLSWENGWKNATNHDAAWVFVKFVAPDGTYRHGQLSQNGHRVTATNSGPKGTLVTPQDGVGLFVQPSDNHRGKVSWQVRLKIDPAVLRNLPNTMEAKVFALEMVYVPQGGFTLGDPDPAALNFSSFFKSDENGRPDGLYQITSETQEIPIAQKAGALYHAPGRQPQYTGDRKGTVPATFPKGVNPFYIMKYETTQGFYADFLNNISPNFSEVLSPHTTEKYYEGRGNIKFVNGKYEVSSPDRPANYITWDDGAALADWAGLRPMTELEFTKAARGPGTPIAHEFPWGTDNTDNLGRLVDLDDELKLKAGLNEGDLTAENRHVYGASYYWVMDLAGSLWEKCVTIGHPIGRSFKGSHGDGKLSAEGKATNADWPKGIAEEGGYGYRGGGYYQHTMRVSEFNPHSPIAYRPYGSWSGGKRSIAYSQRYVRTAPRQ